MRQLFSAGLLVWAAVLQFGGFTNGVTTEAATVSAVPQPVVCSGGSCSVTPGQPGLLGPVEYNGKCNGRIGGCFGDALDKHFARGKPRLSWAGKNHNLVTEDKLADINPQTGWIMYRVPDASTVNNWPVVFVIEDDIADPQYLSMASTLEINCRRDHVYLDDLVKACDAALRDDKMLIERDHTEEVNLGKRRAEITALRQRAVASAKRQKAYTDEQWAAIVEKHDPRVHYSSTRDIGTQWPIGTRKDGGTEWQRYYVNCLQMDNERVEAVVRDIQANGNGSYRVVEVATQPMTVSQMREICRGYEEDRTRSREICLDFGTPVRLAQWQSR